MQLTGRDLIWGIIAHLGRKETFSATKYLKEIEMWQVGDTKRSVLFRFMTRKQNSSFAFYFTFKICSL